MGLYGSFRYGPSFEHRQTGVAPCGYGNGDGKVTLGELQTYLDDEMTCLSRAARCGPTPEAKAT